MSWKEEKGDLISRKALKKAFAEECCGCCDNCSHCMTGYRCELIDNAPAEPQVTVFAENASKEEIADFKQELENVLEKTQGEWLFKEITNDYKVYGQCSICKQRKRIDNYCPNCGADMRKGGAE